MAGEFPVYEGWTVIREIGAGSFGKVYEIQREDFGYTYKAALKVISIPQSKSEIDTARMSEDLTDKKSLQEYFYDAASEIVKEFELMFKLKGNTHIVSYEDHKVVPHEDGIGWDIFIRMELLTPLAAWLDTHKLTRRDVINMGIDLCDAFERCQKFNIIHRDIKPGNIFVSEQGDFKLGDFGVARTMEKHSFMDMSRKGTVNYMAPEVASMGNYGYSVDIYSLGLVMYQLLNNNRMPFISRYSKKLMVKDKEMALSRRFKGEPLPFPVNDHSRLAEIVLKACSFQPEDRYSSPGQMKSELEALLYTKGEWDRVLGESDDIPRGSGGISNGGVTRSRIFGGSSNTEEDLTVADDQSEPDKDVKQFGGSQQTKSSDGNWGLYAVIAVAIIIAVIVSVFIALKISNKTTDDTVPEETPQATAEPTPEPTSEPTPDPTYTLEEGDACTTIEKWNELIAGQYLTVREQWYHADGSTGLSWTYEYDEDGNLIRQTDYHLDGTEWKVLENTYENGLKIGSVLQNYADGTVEISSYEYNNSGDLIRIEVTDEAGDVLEIHSFTYASDGTLEETDITALYSVVSEERIDYPDGSYTVLDYDADGLEVYGWNYDSEGNLLKSYSSLYDYNNRLERQQMYNADGTPNSRAEYSYSEDGSVTSIKTYDADGNPLLDMTYVVGKNGNVTITTTYHTDESMNAEIVINEEGQEIARTDW